jgi:hypothetical protein
MRARFRLLAFDVHAIGLIGGIDLADPREDTTA